MNVGDVDKACKSNAGGWTLEVRYWLCNNNYMGNFKNLDVYKRAHELFPKVYKIVRSWEKVDQHEIGGQIIRAANSIHANLAEGHSKSTKDFKRYISIAIGSCDELRSHIQDAMNVDLIDVKTCKELIEEYEIVGKQLTRLKQSLR